ncbi:ankyrin repeat-containing domain protein, partial [Diaporthe sp. PMI_573]
MTQSRVERANSSTPSFDGLTPLHLAVLQDKYATVRSIVHDGELGMNALTATKTTPLMFAALYGRSDIFLYLLRKGASPDKKDSKGNTPLNYAKPRSAFFQNLLHQYESI